MRSMTSALWLCFVLAVSALPLACGDDDDPDPCADGSCGGAGGDDTLVECTENTDCDRGWVCLDGSCETCSSDGQCSKEQRCDPASFLCTFRDGWGDECTAHQDCSLGTLCSQGLCLPQELVINCGAAGQCPEGMRCNRKAGAPSTCEEDLGCFVNEDCSEEEVCNVGTARCQLACTQENQALVCAAREQCLDGLCIECTADEDCALGLMCNVEAGRCIGQDACFTDRDCEAGKVCNRRIAICTEPPAACTSDVDCLEDERCDIASGRCFLRACVPDLDAPNGTKEEAVTLGMGERAGLVACEGEEKWYKIELSEGDRLSVVIDADALTVDAFDVQLLTEDDRVLQSSVHEIRTTVNHAGTYYLRARTRGGRVHFSLNVLVSKGTPCRNDEFEPNESYSEASALGEGSQPGLVICPGDVDWYVLSVPVGEGVSVSMGQGGSGNLELALYDGDGETRLDADDSTSRDKTVEASQIGGGRAYIKVEASNSRTENTYGLEISLQ